MMQNDEKGYFLPTKVFPCDCGTEGVVVAIEEDDFLDGCVAGPYINMSFWKCGSNLSNNGFLTRWERIKYAWHILKGGSPWTAMVCMSAATARNLSNHIFYILNKSSKRVSEVQTRVKGKPIIL